MPSKKRKIILFAFTLVFLLVSDLTAHADCWYNTNWSHRIKIRVVRSRVSGSHVDFPAYFNLNSLSTTNFFSRVRANGGDIRITRSDGKTELAREVVAINTGTSAGEIHFKIPFLSGGEEFYIYYGNPAANDYATNAAFGAENVWTNSYLVVYHMQENPSTGTLLDSTSNSNDGTPQNMAGEATVTGKVGQAYDFDGVNEYISTAIDGSQFDQITVTTWFDNDLNSTAEHYIYDNSPGTTGYYARLEGAALKTLTAATFTSAAADIAIHGNTLIDTWYYLNHTVDGTNVNIYVNGSLTDIEPQNAIGIRDTGDTFEIARHSDNDVGNEFDGTIDELRIATVPRSATWIRTEFNNQNNPSTFWTVSAQDAQGTQWYGCNWKYRKIIRVVPARVTGTQTDYPAYFDLSNLAATNFFDEVRANGGDIRITQCDGTTELAREIVSINTVNNAGELHFLIPSMSGGEEFFIYYGNPAASDYATNAAFGAQNVWTNNYVMVLHLSDNGNSAANGYADSTANDFDATGVNLTASSDLPGKISKATNFDGSTQFINADAPGITSSSSFTYSAWFNSRSFVNGGASDGAGTYFVDRVPAGNPLVSLKASGGTYCYQTRYNSGGGLGITCGAAIALNTWQYVVWARDYSNLFRIYVNGVAGATRSDAGINALTPDAPKLGRHSTDAFLNGLLDEFRVARTIRSATWVSTEFNNQNSPSTFWDLTVADDTLQIISFTPPDNGTAATVTANLEILFDKIPVLLNGDLIIRRISNGSAFQSFDTNGTTFTVSGNSVRLRLTNPLFYNEYYYVELGCGAFGPIIGAHFPGFNDNGTWNFYSGGMEPEIDFFRKSF